MCTQDTHLLSRFDLFMTVHVFSMQIPDPSNGAEDMWAMHSLHFSDVGASVSLELTSMSIRWPL